MKTLGEEVDEALAPYANGWVARMPFPMALAPRDGRLLRLLVDYSDGEHPLDDELEAWTFGHNNYDNDGEDRWRFAGWCWSHDHFTEGRGTPIGWLPEYESLLPYVSLPRSGRDDLIEQCAVAAEATARVGWEWVRDSLWAKILKRAGDNVRALKAGAK